MNGSEERARDDRGDGTHTVASIRVEIVHAWSDSVLKWFTIAGAAFVIAGTVYQWSSTKQSLRISREAIVNDHRPWVLGRIESISVPMKEATAEAACRKGIKVTAAMKNFGNSPATKVLGIIRPIVGPNRVSESEVNVPRPEHPSKLGISTFVMAPNESIGLPQDPNEQITFDCDAFTSVLRGNNHIYLVFNVWYQGTADRVWHASSHCIQWNRLSPTSFDRCMDVERAE